MNTEEATKRRTEARAKGLRLAAKVATIGGLAMAAFGAAEAGAAGATPTPTHAVASDDAKALPLEGLKVMGGNCGCSPCWGPPAPPAKSVRSARRKRSAAKRPPRARGAR